MLNDVCQLYPRFPHPVIQLGSGLVVAVNFPKLTFAIAPHSPLAAVLLKSHCGMKSRFASIHERVVLLTDAFTGSNKFATPVTAAFTYRLMPALIAVFPSPIGSHATPNRGLRSLQF